MRSEEYTQLRRLAERSEKEFGKLAQKLLALALLDAGATELYERSVQGIDLECTLDGRRLSIEVKTCEGRKLRLGRKDLSGLEARASGGREAWLAVLGSGFLQEWRMARVYPGELVPQRDILLVELRANRDAELEERIREPFARSVARYAELAARSGQGGLDEVLREHPEFRLA